MPAGKKKNGIKDIEKAILAASLAVFARKGFRRTDVDEIARKLDIGKGTIYRHFGSKEKLFLAVADNSVQRLVEKIRGAAATSSDLKERIQAIIYAFLAFFQENPEIIEIFIVERCEFPDRKVPTYISYWERNMHHHAEAISKLMTGSASKKLDPYLASEVLHDMLYGEIFTYCYRTKKTSLSDRAAAVTEIFFNGILNKGE